MNSTVFPKSASNQTAQPAKATPIWSPGRADALRQAAHNHAPGACNCNCGVHKGSQRIER
jgi:hypothetical protein